MINTASLKLLLLKFVIFIKFKPICISKKKMEETPGGRELNKISDRILDLEYAIEQVENGNSRFRINKNWAFSNGTLRSNGDLSSESPFKRSVPFEKAWRGNNEKSTHLEKKTTESIIIVS